MKTPSVRVESYIVMFKELFNGNLFGKGIGAFGGPASLKYHSPYYEQVHFTWPDTYWMKMTTVDTFPPHVFVELGLIGGSLFFLVLISPLFRRYVPNMVIIIYFTLFFDMLFTYSLASLEYMMYSLVLIYPIIYYEQNREQNIKANAAD
jgi:MFS superfamily sulfate permease-like transporter